MSKTGKSDNHETCFQKVNIHLWLGIKLLSQRWWIPILVDRSFFPIVKTCKNIWICGWASEYRLTPHRTSYRKFKKADTPNRRSIAACILSNSKIFGLFTFVLSRWSAWYWDTRDLWDFTSNLMAVDRNTKVLDLHLAVSYPSVDRWRISNKRC